MSVFDDLGFHGNPFAKTNADEEPILSSYFVPPPFFDAVTGAPSTPNSTIVFAPRGGGKTAQRIMVEQWSHENNVLSITYDRFEFPGGQTLDSVDLSYHLKNIIIRILISYLSILSERDNPKQYLKKEEIKILSAIIHTYLDKINFQELNEILRSLKSLPDHFKKFWDKLIGFAQPVANIVLATFGLPPTDFATFGEADRNAIFTPSKYQMDFLGKLVQRLGIVCIYILIDKIDESEKTGANFENSYRLIEPIFRDLDLLGMHGYAFKIFAWDKISDPFQVVARPDRIPQYNIFWKRPALQEVLRKRLLAFSDNKVRNFDDLLETPFVYPSDQIVCLFANHSPRNVIRICEKIIAEAAEEGIKNGKISLRAFDRGINSYCLQISNEIYGGDISRDIKRTGRELFTINYLASEIFKTAHENTSRNKVTGWQKIGLVQRIGTWNTPGSRKPVNAYYVNDPAVIRAIHERETLETFLKDRWIECNHCGIDNLMNIDIVPEDNDVICHDCGRPLY